MKKLFKRRERSLSELQATVEFPDETIDFTRASNYRQGLLEKQPPSVIVRATYMMTAGIFLLVLAALAITLFIYYKSR